jgi:O-antigen ligase
MRPVHMQDGACREIDSADMEETRNQHLVIGAEALALGVLVYAPVAFGSASQVYRPPIWIACTLLFALNLLLISNRNGTGKRTEFPLLPARLFAAFLVLLLLQIVPLPLALVGWLSATVPNGGWTTLHPNPEAGLRAALDWFSAFALFFAAVSIPSSRNGIRRWVYCLLLVAGFEAFYGIVEYAGGSQNIFGYSKVAYLDSATGTFVNRNHFADYLAMAICLWTGVFAYRFAKVRTVKSVEKGQYEKLLLLVFFGVLILAALLMSRSRAGLAGAVFSLAALGAIGFRNRKRLFLTTSLLLLGLVALFSLWLGADPMPTRFGELSQDVLAEDARPEVWWRTVSVIGQSPLLGHGADTFHDAFRVYGGSTVLASYHHAHNDYLETLVQFGLAGFLLLFGGVALTIASTIRSLRNRTSRFARFLAMGALAAAFAFLLHGLVDFPMQIPANRLTFFALIGLAYTVSTRRFSR